jgi:hypothetical protein
MATERTKLTIEEVKELANYYCRSIALDKITGVEISHFHLKICHMAIPPSQLSSFYSEVGDTLDQTGANHV